jgi:hypothetical protein
VSSRVVINGIGIDLCDRMFCWNALKTLPRALISAVTAALAEGYPLQSLRMGNNSTLGITVAVAVFGTIARNDELPAESAQSSRPSWPGVSLGIALAVCALIAWGYLRSGAGAAAATQRQVRTDVLENRTVDDVRPQSTIADAPDIAAPPASGRLIETLRQQVAQSPVLQDGDAQSSLLDALDQAGDIWTKTQRQNRDALRQLNRQVRLGESRQAPSLVIITFEH